MKTIKEIELHCSCEGLRIALQNEEACDRYERKWSDGNKRLREYIEWLKSNEASKLFYSYYN